MPATNRPSRHITQPSRFRHDTDEPAASTSTTTATTSPIPTAAALTPPEPSLSSFMGVLADVVGRLDRIENRQQAAPIASVRSPSPSSTGDEASLPAENLESRHRSPPSSRAKVLGKRQHKKVKRSLEDESHGIQGRPRQGARDTNIHWTLETSCDSSGDEVSVAPSVPRRRNKTKRRRVEKRISTVRSSDTDQERKRGGSSRAGRQRQRRVTPTLSHGRRRSSTRPGRSRQTQSPSSGEQSAPSSSDSARSTDSEYEIPHTSYGTVVGAVVCPTLREKILNNKYLEMSELLPSFKSSSQSSAVTLKQITGNKLRWVREKPNVDIPLGSWCEAFDIFASVYVERSRSRTGVINRMRALMTYRKLICDLKMENADWASYDRHFRHIRVCEPLPWTTIRQDLMNNYRTSSQPFRRPTAPSTHSGSRGKFSGGSGAAVPKGFCRAFHSRGMRCEKGPACTYKHFCPRCDGRHPSFMQCAPWKDTAGAAPRAQPQAPTAPPSRPAKH